MDPGDCQMDVTEFRTHLLRCADRITRTGETIVVTRHDRPIFRVEPVAEPARSLAGSTRTIVPRHEFLTPFHESMPLTDTAPCSASRAQDSTTFSVKWSYEVTIREPAWVARWVSRSSRRICCD
jgi:antitoxin (DNA-binding transcriptional repressor) of toxin-antitoxin stability system